MYLAKIKHEDLKIHYKSVPSDNIFNKVASEINLDLMPVVKLLYTVQTETHTNKYAL